MTESPRRRRIGEGVSEPPVPEPHGSSGPGRYGLSPKAQFAADTLAGVAIALGASVVMAIFGFEALVVHPVWVLLCGTLLAWGFAAPAARAIEGRFREGWGRHVEGLREQRASRWRGPPVPDVGSAAVPAARGQHEKDAERQLLEAIERRGEITPVRAALETPLTVAEADRMLGELTEKGHLQVHARDGKLVYSF